MASVTGGAKAETAVEAEAERLHRLKGALKATVGTRHGLGKEIAEKTGYTVNSVSAMLNGKVRLSEKFIKLVCANFGINETFVLHGPEHPMEMPVPQEKKFIDDKDAYLIQEGYHELQKMVGAQLRHAVAMLMEMNEKSQVP